MHHHSSSFIIDIIIAIITIIIIIIIVFNLRWYCSASRSTSLRLSCVCADKCRAGTTEPFIAVAIVLIIVTTIIITIIIHHRHHRHFVCISISSRSKT